jgi:hypothetical protein
MSFTYTHQAKAPGLKQAVIMDAAPDRDGAGGGVARAAAQRQPGRSGGSGSRRAAASAARPV